MTTEGYMTEEEFKQAIERAAKEICGNVCGPIDHGRFADIRLIITPPQSYRSIALKTYEDICHHIGSIYYHSIGDVWYPNVGKTAYYGSCWCTRRNFPQYLRHDILDAGEFKTMGELTVRNMGCLLFEINKGQNSMPDWLQGFVKPYEKKYREIMNSIPRAVTQHDIDMALKWSEPSEYAKKLVGPTDPSFIELWRIMTKKRLDERVANQDKVIADIRAQLDALSAKMITFLEKIPFKPKYGELTNCADVPIAAVQEEL